MKFLAFVPRPLSCESPTSLLIRTAKANGFINVKHMCQALSIKHRARMVELRLDIGPLCEFLCMEAPILATEIRRAFYQQPYNKLCRGSSIVVSGQEVSRRLIENNFRPCPACVKQGFTCFPQDLSVFDQCPFHHLSLLNECPHCKQTNGWFHMNGFTCHCGFDYQQDIDLRYELVP